MTKLFQYDKKTWHFGKVDRTWQFGIIKNRALLGVAYTNPGYSAHSSGCKNILFSFFRNSLMSVDFQQHTFGLTFAFFAEYLEGWDT
jgi:hypothetical protein